jgi:shikimate dehydrogenase
MIEASVIGWPINHSRSPLIHGYWLKKHGLAGTYTRQAVEPGQLQNFIRSLTTGERVGCNVTIPHKEKAIAFVDHPDERVRQIGALNTIWRGDDGKLHATSTDGPGFVANVINTLPEFEFRNGPVIILGAGGSTRGLTDELLRQGVDQICIWNRTESRAQSLAGEFGSKVMSLSSHDLETALTRANLLINTTAAGMNGEGELALPWEKLRATAVVADIVYTPLVTPFLQRAESRGHAVVTGLGMLLHQAVVGFEKWFGVRPEVTSELYDLVARDIDPDYTP